MNEILRVKGLIPPLQHDHFTKIMLTTQLSVSLMVLNTCKST